MCLCGKHFEQHHRRSFNQDRVSLKSSLWEIYWFPSLSWEELNNLIIKVYPKFNRFDLIWYFDFAMYVSWGIKHTCAQTGMFHWWWGLWSGYTVIIIRKYLLLESHQATEMYNEWTYSSRTLRVSVMFLLVSSMSVIISFSTPHWLDSYGTQRLPNPKFTNLGM